MQADEISKLVLDRHQDGWLLSLKGHNPDKTHDFELVISPFDLERLAQAATEDVRPGQSPMFYLGAFCQLGVTTEGLEGIGKVRLHFTQSPDMPGLERFSSVDITYEEFRRLGQILTEELATAAW
jgi:hypothetical protein